MKDDCPGTVQDCPASVFVLYFNELSELSVISLLTERVEIEDDAVLARVSIWNG